MAGYQDILNQYLATDAALPVKQIETATASERKQAELNSKQAYALGVTAATGLGFDTVTDPVESDLLNLTPNEVMRKYGRDKGAELLAAYVRGSGGVSGDLRGTRDLWEGASDSLNKAVTGLAGGLGGIAGFGTSALGSLAKTPVGLVNEDAANAIGEVASSAATGIASGVDNFSKFMDQYTSPASRGRQELQAEKQKLRERDAIQQAEKDIASGENESLSQAERVLSEFGGAVADVATDPIYAADLVAQGVGSMLAVPPVLKGLQALAPAKAVEQASAALTRAIGSKAGGVVGKAAAPSLAVGLTEAGGTYQQGVMDVLNAPIESLYQTSPQYREMLDSGADPEVARAQLADAVGANAGLMQLPSAIAAGSLTGKFAANPLAGTTVKEAAQNIATEALEEGIQSGSSALLRNVAKADLVDENQDLLSGVGTEAGIGAAAGMGTAGALSTPAILRSAKNTAVDTTKDFVNARAEKLATETEAAHPSAPAKVASESQQLAELLPDVLASIANDPTKAPANQESLSGLASDLVNGVLLVDGKSISENVEYPSVVREAAASSVTQVELLNNMAKIANDPLRNISEQLTAQLFIEQTLTGVNQYIDSIQKDELKDIPAGHPLQALVSGTREIIKSLSASPQIARAIQGAQAQAAKAVQEAPLTEATATPEAVDAQIAAATLAPESTTLEGVETILKMVSSGQRSLSNEQVQNLEMLRELHKRGKAYDDRLSQMGEPTAQSRVSAEIKTGQTGKVDEELSAMQHAQGIRNAVVRGETEDAASRLEYLGAFAQHMQNKVGAINAHINLDNPNRSNSPSYVKLVGSRGSHKFVDSGATKQGVTPTNAKSIHHAQLVEAEANFVTETYNALTNIFPELNLPAMPSVELDKRLLGKSSVVADEFSKGLRKSGKPTEAAPASTATDDPPSKEGLEQPTSVDANQQRKIDDEVAAMQLPELSKAVRASVTAAMKDPSEINQYRMDALIQRMEDLSAGTQEPEVATATEMTQEAKDNINYVVEGLSETEVQQQISREQKALLESPESAQHRYTLEQLNEAQNDAPEVKDAPEPIREVVSEVRAPTEPATATKVEPKPQELVESVDAIQPEQEQEIPVEGSGDSSTGLPKLYPNLIGGGKNKFVASYSLPNSPISKVESQVTPIAYVMGEIEREGDSTASNIYKALLVDMFPKVARHSNKLISAAMGKRPKVRDSIVNNSEDSATESVKFPELRSLAIAEASPNGEIAMNVPLLSKAHLAGVNWLLNGINIIPAHDIDRAHKILGVPTELVTDAHMSLLSTGVTRLQAIDALASNIQRYWGVKANSAVIDGYTKGIVMAVAGNLIDAYLGQTIDMPQEDGSIVTVPLLTKGTIAVTDFEGGVIKTVDVYIPADLKAGIAAPYRSMLEKIVAVKPELVFYIGEDVPPVATTQMNNPAVQNTPEQVKMIEQMNATEYKVIPHMLDAYNAMGIDAIVDLFGEGVLDKALINKNDLVSKEGRNLGIIGAWNTIQDLVFSVTAQTEDEGTAIDAVPVRYAHNVSSVGRAQQLGRHTPQSSKIMRSVILPTQSKVLNLTDTTGSDYRYFMLSVGQMLGEKVHNFSPDVTIQRVQDSISGKYREVIEILQDHLLNDGRQFSSAELTVFNRALRKPNEAPTFEMFQALMEYAKFLNTDDKSNYTTKIYIEADGMTNGPFNSMLLYTYGAFTSSQLANLAKCGLYFDGPPESQTSWVRRTLDKVDLYEEISQRTTAYIGEARASLDKYRTSKNTQTKLGAQNYLTLQEQTTSLMQALLPGVSVDPVTGTIAISRGVVKNPSQIIAYGSGAKGIADTLTRTMFSELYTRMSNALKAQAENHNITAAQALFPESADAEGDLGKLAKAFQTTTQQRGGYSADRDMYYAVSVKEGSKQQIEISTAFTVDHKAFAAISQNVLTYFVNPLVGAVKDTIGESVYSSMNSVVTSSQLQGIILGAAYEQRAKEVMPAPGAEGYVQGGYLSQAQQNDIFKSLEPLSPFVQPEGQSFYFAGSEKSGALGKTAYGASLNKSVSTAPTIYTPSNPGVSAAATVVIGPGDGKMIQNFFQSTANSSRALPTFDGIQLPIDDIQRTSLEANQAALEADLGNPMQAIADSFTQFTTEFTKGNYVELTDAVKLDLYKTMVGKQKLTPEDEKQATSLTKEDIANSFARLAEEMVRQARGIQARHNVLSKVNLGIDQMAAAGSPYTITGKQELVGTLEEISVQLNELLETEIALLNGSQVPKQFSSRKSDTEGLYADIPTANETGVSIIFGDALESLLGSTLIKLPRLQRTIVTSGLRKLVDDGYKIVYGAKSELAAYNESLGANGLSGIDLNSSEDATLGMFSPSRKEIWLASSAPETLVHEIIHATTYNQVLGYYESPSTASTETTTSVQAIEGLMEQFMELDVSRMGEPVRANYATARKAIEGILNSDPAKHSDAVRKAGALNEYMAYSLSNSSLAKEQSKVLAKLSTLVTETLKAIKALIWGKHPQASSTTSDITSNLLFHTQVLMAQNGSPNLDRRMADTTLMQSEVYGANERLVRINELFDQKITQHITGKGLEQNIANIREEAHSQMNALTVRGFLAAGFPMTMQEASTFDKVVTALGTQAEIDPVVMARMQELYTAASSSLDVESFMAAPEAMDPNDYAQAQAKFDAIMGRTGYGRDKLGRTTLMPAFMALALVNDTFREVLAKLPAPRADKSPQIRSFDQLLENTANGILDKLADVITRDKYSPNITASVDNLAAHLMDTANQRQSFFDQYVTPLGTQVDRANALVVEGMGRLADTAKRTYDSRVKAGKDKAKLDKVINIGLGLSSSIISEPHATAMGETLITGANSSNMSKWLHDLVGDLIGRVPSNAELYDRIKIVRSAVQRVRNQFRVELPKTFAKQFTRAVTSAEWAAMYSALGRTDLSALLVGAQFAQPQVMEMLKSPATVIAAITKLEQEIQTAEPTYASMYVTKSKDLAKYLMTGEHSHNMARNAYAIVARLGTSSMDVTNERLVAQVDALTTLHALSMLPKVDAALIAELVTSQSKGIEFVFGYLQGLAKEEKARITDNVPKFNHYKGHLPQLPQDGVSLVIADDSKYSALAGRSYVRVADYVNSSLDTKGPKQGYYLAPVNGLSMFNQGIIQNVRQVVGGVDPLTGYTVGGVLGGRITNVSHIRAIANTSKTEQGSTLSPVYGEAGNVIAYERTADPAQVLALNYSTNLGSILGVWKGRLTEELLSEAVNSQSINAAGAMYRKDTANGTKASAQYVNLFDPAYLRSNPVIADSVKLLTPTTIAQIQAEFGGDKFMARKEMVDNLVGYRSATVGDVWTGNSYWSKETQEGVRKAAMLVFGNSAYAKLVNSEGKLKTVVADAKTIIIVKSIVVPIANIMSGALQLVARGVPMKNILAGIPRKLIEVNKYVASEKRAIEIEALLHSDIEPTQKRKLAVELKAIQDSHKRMSIWPLIERGELSSMADDAQPEDVELTSGRLSEYMEKQVNKLPPAVQAVGKYALITKDTALYKGLRKSVEYGDFIAKAILWDDLVIRQGKDVAYANGRVTEEFVNYDRLGGRHRQYLESMGLLWFYNFKIRSTKVALSIVRNNPLHMILAATFPMPDVMGNIGTPLSDNLFSQVADGSLGHSIGVGQLFNAPLVHPLDSLLF